MRTIKKCMMCIRDTLIENNKMKQCELVNIVSIKTKIGKRTIRNTLRMCIEQGVINIINVQKSKAMLHEWVLGSEIPIVEYKPDIDNKFDYPRQSIIKADLCGPAKFKYNQIDILLHMLAAPQQTNI